MSSVAARWTAWTQKHNPQGQIPGLFISGPSGSLPPGVPFLPDELTNARLVVELAFGADLTDTTGASWTWFDVTSDVLFEPGIHISVGKQSENSTAPPASATLTLNNSSGNYTQYDYRAKYWPNNREGTPVRVRLVINWISYTRFQGRVVQLHPAWDETGNYAVTEISASGQLRTLQLRTAPVRSAMARGIATGSATPPIWYIPGEDGQYATFAASGLPGGVNMTVTTGSPAFYSVNGFPGSDKQIGLSGSGLFSAVPNSTAYPFVDRWTYSMAVRYPGAISTSNFLAEVWLADPGTGVWRFDLVAVPVSGASTGMQLYYVQGPNEAGPYSNSLKVDDGNWHFLQLQVVQSGSNINATLLMDGAIAGSVSIPSVTLTRVIMVTVNPDADATNPPDVGHMVVRNSTTSNDLSYTTGWLGEAPNIRMSRLCSENSVKFATNGLYSTSVAMGSQGVDALVNLLQETEITDAGTLYDGFDDGIQFQGISQRWNQSPQFALDATKGEIQPSFNPVRDDFERVNSATVTRKNGAVITYQDLTGPVGVNAVGLYQGGPAVDLNYSSDAPVFSRASWEVYRGTFDGFRYPSLTVNMRKVPSRAAAVAGMLPGLSFTVTPPYSATFPTDSFDLIAEGWEETITNLIWEVTFYCTRQDIFTASTIADSQRGRIGPNGHTLGADAHVGDSSISLVTPSGLPVSSLWTTAVADFPMTLIVDGIRLVVTAISGSSSPQTATLDGSTPVPRFIQAGKTVSLWKDGVIAL